MVNTKIAGACLCGQVTYKSEQEPSMIAVCHCVDCQKQSGGAFSVNVLVPTDSVQIDGASLAQYIVDGDSGMPVTRNFCNNCGSPISTQLIAFDNLSAIKSGTLNDSSWVKPNVQIWCDTKCEWGVVDTSISAISKNPD